MAKSSLTLPTKVSAGGSNDVIVRRIRNRAAVGDRAQAGTPARSETVVNLVAVDKSAAPAHAARDTVREHLQNRVELRACKVAIGISAAHEKPEFFLANAACRRFQAGKLKQGRLHARGASSRRVTCDRRHHLLRQNIERFLGKAHPVQFPRAHGANRRRRLHEVVARQGIDDPFGYRSQPMAGATHALQESRESARRPDLTHQVHVPDIDAEFERSRGNHRGQLSRL